MESRNGVEQKQGRAEMGQSSSLSRSAMAGEGTVYGFSGFVFFRLHRSPLQNALGSARTGQWLHLWNGLWVSCDCRCGAESRCVTGMVGVSWQPPTPSLES